MSINRISHIVSLSVRLRFVIFYIVREVHYVWVERAVRVKISNLIHGSHTRSPNVYRRFRDRCQMVRFFSIVEPKGENFEKSKKFNPF